LSPYREETTASFKVNRSMNRWYDFGDGKGGNIIDFGILYHNCSVKELLIKFSKPFSFQQQNIEVNKRDEEIKKLRLSMPAKSVRLF
jgi:DNA primase